MMRSRPLGRFSGSRLARWLTRIGLGTLGVGIVLAGLAYARLRASLPQTEGTIALPGLDQPVRVVRDRYGVPTIQAQTRRDAARALGFVHAQDRLFQMDLQRRLGAGRLSEIFGEAALGTDRTMRTLGLYRRAEAGLGVLSPEFRGVLDAYADGVNAVLHAGGTLPLETDILRYRPDDWRPADTLVIGKLLALQLTGNYGTELVRARLAATLSADEIVELFPNYPKDAPVTLGRLHDLGRELPLDALLEALPFGAEPRRASNNWVVDGAHSATGLPLLANDPHLDYAAPLVWYLARIDTPDMSVAGATIAGNPGVVLGHNDRIAWGYTTTNADAEDLFIERPDPTDPSRYLVPGGSAPFEVRQERIAVKGRQPDLLAVRSTRHGPVISDIANGTAPGGPVLALQASFLVDDDRSVEAQWRASLARDWTGWRDALRDFVGPPQNMVYADRDGHIGFQMPGRIPIRRSGDGRAPVDGQAGEHDWTGFVPFDELPHGLDPPAGRFASANNRIVPEDYPYLITRDWDLPFRITRIEAVLASVPQQSLDSSTTLQGDIVSLAAETLLPLLLEAEPNDARSREAIGRLRAWDRRMPADRPEPLIYAAWMRAVNRRLFEAKLGAVYGRSFTPSPLVTAAVLRQHRHWCGPEGCPAQLRAALAEALDGLTRLYGADQAAWRWGDAHPASFDHPLFSRIPLLRDLYDRRLPADGGNDTVNVGGFRPGEPATPFADVHGPGLRAVYDLGDLDGSRFELALGQSAHPLSPHYDDLQRLWRRLEGIRLPRDPQGQVLSLVPG